MLANSLIVRSEVWKTDESNPKIPPSDAGWCSLSMPYCPNRGRAAEASALKGWRVRASGWW